MTFRGEVPILLIGKKRFLALEHSQLNLRFQLTTGGKGNAGSNPSAESKASLVVRRQLDIRIALTH